MWRMLWLEEKRMFEKVNCGNNSIDKKQKPRQKGHPLPWKNGTQPG
jgi:hypothetical protein